VRDATARFNCSRTAAHRGALIAFDAGGNVPEQLKCILSRLELTTFAATCAASPSSAALNGLAACPRISAARTSARRKLRTATLGGLVFATLSPDAPPIEDYIGKRGAGPPEARAQPADPGHGALVQTLPSKWKLYVENSKDTYHASLLHLFLTTFRINRLTQAAACW